MVGPVPFNSSFEWHITTKPEKEASMPEQEVEDVVDVTAVSGEKKDTETPSSASDERGRFMFALLSLLFLVNGFFFGLSPLVVPISVIFDESGDSYIGGVFLYGFAINYLSADLMALVILDLLKRRPPLRSIILNTGIASAPLALGFLAFMVHLRSFVGLLVAFLVMAYPMAVIVMYLLHAEMPLWYYGDEMPKAASYAGFTVGGGALFWTFLMGEMTNALGKENVVFVILAAAVITGVPLLLILVFCNPAFLVPKVLKEREPSSTSPSKDEVVKFEEESAACTTAESATSKEAWWKFLIRDRRAKLYSYVTTAFLFCGHAMKLLLSTLFEETLELSYVDATRLAAVCLLMYLPGRGLTPLYCSQNRVFKVFLVVLIFEAAAYALTPWAISLSITGSKQLSLGCYTTLRLISGGGFAMLLGNVGVLVVRVFSMDEIHKAVACFIAIEWIAGIGPSVAWIIHVEARRKSHGTREEARSFDGFFYLCAAIAVSAVVGVVALRREVSKEEAKRSIQVKLKEEDIKDKKTKPN